MEWIPSVSLISLLLVTLGCASTSSPLRAPTTNALPEIHLPSREEAMGPNRARYAIKPTASNQYLFRNVSSAFPDPGKNMILKERALPKSTVTGAIDHSPWHLRLYQDSRRIQENRARFSNLNRAFYSTPLSQREALILAHSPKKEVGETFYQTETFGRDDSFEPNNNLEMAFDLSNVEERWLGLLGGPNYITEGVQWDEDWYQIYVSPQYRRLMLDLRVQHYLGDVDMKLFDSNGRMIAASQGVGEDEFLHLILDRGGFYYVQVFGSNKGNRYDFKYSTFFTGGGDDEYEDNDSLKNAFDLREYKDKYLSEIRGEGVAADNDYYLIRVPAGQERVQVDLRVDVAHGDVDVRLLDLNGKIVASSAHIGDDDYIDFRVPKAGNYYLKVYPFAPQSTFNLYDLKWNTFKPSQKRSSKVLLKKENLVSTSTR